MKWDLFGATVLKGMRRLTVIDVKVRVMGGGLDSG
jgi:hypothetical protein